MRIDRRILSPLADDQRRMRVRIAEKSRRQMGHCIIEVPHEHEIGKPRFQPRAEPAGGEDHPRRAERKAVQLPAAQIGSGIPYKFVAEKGKRAAVAVSADGDLRERRVKQGVLDQGKEAPKDTRETPVAVPYAGHVRVEHAGKVKIIEPVHLAVALLEKDCERVAVPLKTVASAVSGSDVGGFQEPRKADAHFGVKIHVLLLFAICYEDMRNRQGGDCARRKKKGGR